MYVLIRYVAFALSYTQPHSLPDEFPASRPYCRCTFSSAFAYLLLRRFPLAFCHKLPYICFACIHFTSLQFPVSLAKRCSVCSSVRNPLVSWWGLSYFPCGSFPCVSRSILYAFIVRIVQFISVSLAFRSLCLVFSVLVSLYFPMNSFMFSRWVPAIFALPSLFVTLRVSYTLNGIFPCTLLCKFSVYSTCFPSVFCSAFTFFPWPSPARSDIRYPFVLSWFSSEYPPKVALHF